MIFIKRNKESKIFKSQEIKSLKEIVSNFFKRPYTDRIQEKFQFPPFPDFVKLEVEKQFKKKCAYCESKLDVFSPSYIDNFRPKRGARGFEKNEFYDDHYWWLAYEWENLYLSCPECNKNKGSWFPIGGDLVKASTYGKDLIKEVPLLIDPCLDQPSEHFIFNENGEVESFTEKGRVTIEILKLNRTSLIKSRKEELNRLKNNYDRFLKFINTLRLNSVKENFFENSVVSSLFELLLEHPEASFVALKRQFFFNWLIKEKDILEYLFSFDALNPYIAYVISDQLSTTQIWENLFFSLGWLKREKKIFGPSDFDFSKLDTLEKIEIKNFRTINELEIDLGSNQSEKTPWLLFLGENGLGKSSILQAIAYTLADDEYREKIPINKILKAGEKSGYVKIFLTGKKSPIALNFNEKGMSIHNSGFGSFVLGYGATRLLPQRGIDSEDNKGKIRLLNLFYPTIALHNASSWLYNLDVKRFDFMARALKEILFPQNIIKIEKGKKKNTINIFHENRIDTLYEMSEGYKSVVALAVDIMQILDRDGTSMEEAQGVVLIDEIGSHLHPRWRMRIVNCFRKVFPKVQFIVTTHEPLCLRGLEEKEVVVLKRDFETKEVEIIKDLPSPSGFRVDQLLTSEFFGLYSTSDPDIEEAFNKYYKLLAISRITNSQSEELSELKAQLSEKKFFGNTIREELMYTVIYKLLAKEYNDDKFINRKKLKEATIEKVRELWKENGIID